MKHIASIITIVAVLAGNAAAVPMANQAWVTNKLNQATNATLSAAKAYTDEKTASGSMTTNAVKGIINAEVGGTNNLVRPAQIADMATKTWVGGKGYLTAEQDPTVDTKVAEAIAAGMFVRTNLSGYIEGTSGILLLQNTSPKLKLDMWGVNFYDANGNIVQIQRDETSAPGDAHIKVLDATGEISTFKTVAYMNDAGTIATNVVRATNAGVWDSVLQVWWSPVMSNGKLTYQATTNVNINAGN